MSKKLTLKVTLCKNKSNGQVNLSLPVKKLPKDLLKDMGRAKISIEKLYPI